MLGNKLPALIIFAIAAQQICSTNAAVFAAVIGQISSVLGIADFAYNYNPLYLSQQREVQTRQVIDEMYNSVHYEFKEIKKLIAETVNNKYLEKLQELNVRLEEVAENFKEIIDKKDEVAEIKDREKRSELVREFRYSHYSKISRDTKKIYRLILNFDYTQVDLVKNFTTDEQVVKHFCKLGKSHMQWYDGLISTLQLATNLCLLGQYLMDDLLDMDSTLVWENIGIEYLNRPKAYDLLKKYNESVDIIKRFMFDASAEVWTCDVDYTEFERYPNNQESPYYELVAFQKYLFKEALLDAFKCAKKCNTVERIHSCSWTRDFLCRQTRLCPNDLVGCKSLDVKSKSNVHVCINDEKSVSRYNFIVPDDEDLPSKCSKEHLMRLEEQQVKCIQSPSSLNLFSSDLTFAFSSPDYDCSNACLNCECICPDKIYYISLHSVLAKADENKVVTAAKLSVVKDTMVIQIKESKLGANGSVSDESEWSPVNNIERQNRVPITWDGIRSIDLTNAVLKCKENVLTGLKFERHPTTNHISLAIFSSKFNFRSGVIGTSAGIYLEKQTPKPATKEFNLENVDVPTRSSRPNLPDSSDDQYVTFTISSLEKDGGQTTVPFIDTQPVITTPPTLLAGAGLYHKGQKGYGGFISLKLYTFDITPFITSGLEGKLCKDKKSFCLH